MSPAADKTPDSKAATRKRSAESPPVQVESPSPQNEPKAKRARTNAAHAPEQNPESPRDEWDLLGEKLNDVFSGRADNDLNGWEQHWGELCDSLHARKGLRETENKTMKELGAIIKRCAGLERRLGIRDR
ncbi:hypothetical protein AURDEDRAFT_161778 [Auricularia subglabra TFB-10046 SS5]|nr:hypothetical protein AURDEDRAFT_161778 [Auricularia subglabra TFB-10046 SS5]